MERWQVLQRNCVWYRRKGVRSVVVLVAGVIAGRQVRIHEVLGSRY